MLSLTRQHNSAMASLKRKDCESVDSPRKKLKGKKKKKFLYYSPFLFFFCVFIESPEYFKLLPPEIIVLISSFLNIPELILFTRAAKNCEYLMRYIPASVASDTAEIVADNMEKEYNFEERFNSHLYETKTLVKILETGYHTKKIMVMDIFCLDEYIFVWTTIESGVYENSQIRVFRMDVFENIIFVETTSFLYLLTDIKILPIHYSFSKNTRTYPLVLINNEHCKILALVVNDFTETRDFYKSPNQFIGGNVATKRKLYYHNRNLVILYGNTVTIFRLYTKPISVQTHLILYRPLGILSVNGHMCVTMSKKNVTIIFSNNKVVLPYVTEEEKKIARQTFDPDQKEDYLPINLFVETPAECKSTFFEHDKYTQVYMSWFGKDESTFSKILMVPSEKNFSYVNTVRCGDKLLCLASEIEGKNLFFVVASPTFVSILDSLFCFFF